MSTNQQQDLQSPGQRPTPGQVASVIGMLVRAFVVIVFWIVAAAVVGCAGYVALRTLWWALREVTRALGI